MGRSTTTRRTKPASNTPAIARHLRVRMYRHGLGDCFLLSVTGAAGKPFHMMIDCGVLQQTKGLEDRLTAVLNDVIDTTGGKLDVLVVTHEHYDHVAGFVELADKFAAAGKAESGKLAVGAVWFAWTEDPSDQLARDIRAQRDARKNALAGLADRLHGMGVGAPEVPAAVAGALGFFGVNASAGATGGKSTDGLGTTGTAMKNAAGFAPPGHIRYFKPGDIWEDTQALPGIRVLVLGPPHNQKSLNKTNSTTEVYHLDADGLEEAVRMSAAGGGADIADDPFSPFEKPYRRMLSALKDDITTLLGGFLAGTYFNQQPATPETDRAWRRIDGAWLGSAEQLALALDSATNNTSLVLAIEITGTKEVLLFPGDAQVGNWLSWHDVTWDGFTTKDLLGRVTFYKVGHHGSHNATARAKGLEMMTKPGLTAFIPVDHTRAVEKRWFEMPLPALIDALHKGAGNTVVRIDEDAPGIAPGVSAGGTGGPFGTLYYDWTCSVPD